MKLPKKYQVPCSPVKTGAFAHIDNPLMQSPLDKLLAIDGWGKRNFSGNFFSVKFRIPKHKQDAVAKIKAKHPETIVYFTKGDYILFGGRYSKTGSFLFDVKTIAKIKVE